MGPFLAWLIKRVMKNVETERLPAAAAPTPTQPEPARIVMQIDDGVLKSALSQAQADLDHANAHINTLEAELAKAKAREDATATKLRLAGLALDPSFKDGDDVEDKVKRVYADFVTEKTKAAELTNAQAATINELTTQLKIVTTSKTLVENHRAEELTSAIIALELLLQRPDRVLEIFGQDVYQAAKDTFVLLGGDGSKLPMPKPTWPVQ